MLTITGRHDGRQIFASVALMSIESLDGLTSDDSKQPDVQVLNALIDTGATTTSITPKTAEKLGLLPMGMHRVLTASGIQNRPSYLLRVGFASFIKGKQNFLIPDKAVEATETPRSDFPFDVLIGMDVITQGKLLVTPTRYEFTFEPPP